MLRKVDFVDITLTQLSDFISSLTMNERKYYPVPLVDVLAYSIYIRGYWDNDVLLGVGGVTHRYLFAFGQYPIVKEEYWGKGWGTKILGDAIAWIRNNNIPFTIFQYDSNNGASRRMHEKLGYNNDYRIGKHWVYNYVPFCWWARLLTPVMKLFIYVFHVTHKRG